MHSIAIVTDPRTDEVQAHSPKCADLTKKNLRNQTAYTLEVASQREAFLDYNEEFIADADGDESNGWPIRFLPCCGDIPETVEEAPATRTAKVGKKWTYIYDFDGSLIAEIRNDHQVAITALLHALRP